MEKFIFLVLYVFTNKNNTARSVAVDLTGGGYDIRAYIAFYKGTSACLKYANVYWNTPHSYLTYDYFSSQNKCISFKKQQT